jgi:SAM-dependent methyltransferase
MSQMTCRICDNEAGNTSFQTKEMMFGLRDEFTYIECAQCGVVQIETVPAEMARYYPASYYSYARQQKDPSALKLWRQRHAYQQRFGDSSLLGALAALFSHKLPAWMNSKYFRFASRILDVGCGSGELLLELQRGGFGHLTGADPFIAADIHYAGGVSIFKKDFLELEGKFDFIMFHHSFEHMAEPLKIFQRLAQALNPGGAALIRIPVADSYAYRTYRAHWVNLDPPRHFFLHTPKSIGLLTKQVGLRLAEVIYDSTHMQFYGSELYRRDLTLEAYNQGQHRDLFSKPEMRKFRIEAARLNQKRDGDLACFFIQKP